MNKRYEDVKTCKLSEIFSIDSFRLINNDSKYIPYGITEIPVIIDLKKDFRVELSFDIPWDGELWGFVRDKEIIYSNIGCDTGSKITISNWDEKFIIIFEDEKGKEGPVFCVEKSEIVNLLEECIKPAKLV